MKKNIQKFLQKCLNCQISQDSKKKLKHEITQHQVDEKLLLFKHWRINLIDLLSITSNKNQWIIMIIDYVTRWLIACAVVKAIKKKIIHFIHEKIFINYEVLQKILSNNNINLISAAVKHYISQLNTQHHTTTSYHSRMNEKMKNLNRTLNQMLIKYLMSKSTQLWNEYFSQTLFVVHVWLHAVIKKSSFYLLYRIHSWISVNNNKSKKTDEIQNSKKHIEQMNHVKILINKLLLNRALKTKKIRDIKMIQTHFKKSNWILIHNKELKKFQLKWFESYYMLKAHSLEMYALKKLSEQILQNLINKVRLIKTDVKKSEHLWSLSVYMRALKKKEFTLEKSVKVQHIMNMYKSKTISYSKLSIITKKEWMKQKYTNMRHTSVEKKNSIVNYIVTKSHAKAHKNMKNMTKRSSDEKKKCIST